ncbi:MAG: CapA family protein [Myxococcales bacterium]|nr:CapA family protein [Myxococcales bacterium]MCB9751171.1 CapA family protein [Myxococcales bacterium]
MRPNDHRSPPAPRAHLRTWLLGPGLGLGLLACNGHASSADGNGQTDAPSERIAELESRVVSTPSPAPEPDPPAPEPEPEPTPLRPEELPEGYLHFAGACDPGERVTIAAVGDVLLHEELQVQAYAAPERHLALWGGVVDLLSAADVTYANLEGPMAAGVTRSGKQIRDPGLVYDNVVYSAYPRFNFHPSLAESLVKSGVDVVSTANNHSLDRHAIGVDKTLEALDAASLLHTGTRRQSASARLPWHVMTETRGVRLAWLACAKNTNQIPDDEDQVLYCTRNSDQVVKLVKRLAREDDIDGIIVTPHWGHEYQTAPRKQQQELAHRLAEAGATAIIGSHPHVTQPWEKYATEDGREVFIHYSLGNFASHQTDLPRRSSVILYVGVTKAPDGRARVNGVRYVPIHVRQDGDDFRTEAIDRGDGADDSRALLVEMYGRYNLLPPDAPLETSGHCRAGFEFPAR